MTTPTPLRRRWFRFRLRTLIIVVAAVAVPLAWVAKERRQSWHEQQLAEQLRQQGFELVLLGGPYDSWQFASQDQSQGWWRELAREILGERIWFIWIPPSDLHDLESLTGLTNLMVLNIRGAPVNDLKPLVGVKTLLAISLEGTLVSDLTPLAGLTNLEELRLTGTRVTKEEVESLQRALPNCTIEHDLP
jgi:hypothetical protein